MKLSSRLCEDIHELRLDGKIAYCEVVYASPCYMKGYELGTLSEFDYYVHPEKGYMVLNGKII